MKKSAHNIVEQLQFGNFVATEQFERAELGLERADFLRLLADWRVFRFAARITKCEYINVG